MEIIPNVAGVVTPWVVIATEDNIPNGVMGASLAMRSINWAAFGNGSPRFSLN